SVAGLAASTVDQLRRALAVPDEVLAKLPDVVAHQSEELPLKARLLILLLGRPAVAEKIRARGALLSIRLSARFRINATWLGHVTDGDTEPRSDRPLETRKAPKRQPQVGLGQGGRQRPASSLSRAGLQQVCSAARAG